jgi:hypothetical protein
VGDMPESYEYGATSCTVLAPRADFTPKLPACLGVSSTGRSTEIRLGLVSSKLQGPCMLTCGTEEHKMNAY